MLYILNQSMSSYALIKCSVFLLAKYYMTTIQYNFIGNSNLSCVPNANVVKDSSNRTISGNGNVWLTLSSFNAT